MDCNELLKKYYARLVREAVVKSAAIGLIVGLGVGAAIMGLSWITTEFSDTVAWLPPAFNGTWISILAAILVAAVGTALLYRFAFRPTVKEAARRLDALGLEERTVTMLSMAKSDHPIAELQRKDTAGTLASVPPTRLKLNIRKAPIIIACLLLVTVCSLIIVPNAMGLFVPPVDEQEIIDQLIEDLRQEIENAENVRDEVKEELNQIVDDLEESLKDMDSTEEKIDKITETADQIRDTIQKNQTHNALGEALKEHENTEDLGEAIQNGDTEAVEDALDDIRDKIEQAGKDSNESMSEELKNLASSIDQALDKAGQEGDPLTESLENLSGQLKDAAEKSEQNDMEGASDKTDQAISDAKQEISEALGQQKGEEKLDQEMQGSMQDALEQLGQSSDGKGKETGGKGEGADKPKEDQPPEPGAADGEPVDTSDKTNDTPLDDPYGLSFKDGETPYSSEFDAYFKQEMAKLEDTDLSQEMKEIIAKYYASIKMEADNQKD